jgi:hypothetical protein
MILEYTNMNSSNSGYLSGMKHHLFKWDEASLKFSIILFHIFHCEQNLFVLLF